MPLKNRGPIIAMEDSDEDFEFMQLSLRRCGADNPLIRLADGDAAFAYIESAREDALPRPALLLVDLNLPGADGRDLIRELRRQPALAALPLVVLSTSGNPRDVRLCYARGASCYVIKPVGLAELERVMAGIAEFWLDVVELPGGG